MRPEFTDGLPPHHQRILISGQRVPLPKFSREMQVARARACAHALVRASRPPPPGHRRPAAAARPPPPRAPAVRTTRVRCVSFCLCCGRCAGVCVLLCSRRVDAVDVPVLRGLSGPVPWGEGGRKWAGVSTPSTPCMGRCGRTASSRSVRAGAMGRLRARTALLRKRRYVNARAVAPPARPRRQRVLRPPAGDQRGVCSGDLRRRPRRPAVSRRDRLGAHAHAPTRTHARALAHTHSHARAHTRTLLPPPGTRTHTHTPRAGWRCGRCIVPPRRTLRCCAYR